MPEKIAQTIAALKQALADFDAPAAEWQQFAGPPETCTFCDRPAADLPTADWPMCEACYEAVAAPYPEELCDPLF